MKKFWRSGMIDKKVVVERERNVILDFGEDFIIAAPRERLKDSMFNAYSRWLKNRGPYDSDLKFEKQAFGENKDENNTRTLRQEE